MRQLICWTLATLFNIARINKPTPAEVTRFNLEGWENDGWFTATDNGEKWHNWVNATWGIDLHGHNGDSWLSYNMGASTSADSEGRMIYDFPTATSRFAPGETLGYELWRTCRGDFIAPGNFLESIVDQYCDSIYPPGPSPEPTPPVSITIRGGPAFSLETITRRITQTGLVDLLFPLDELPLENAPYIFTEFDLGDNEYSVDGGVIFMYGFENSPTKDVDIKISKADATFLRYCQADEVFMSFNFKLKDAYKVYKYRFHNESDPSTDARIIFAIPDCFDDNWKITFKYDYTANKFYFHELETETTTFGEDYYRKGYWLFTEGNLQPKYNESETFGLSKYNFTEEGEVFDLYARNNPDPFAKGTFNGVTYGFETPNGLHWSTIPSTAHQLMPRLNMLSESIIAFFLSFIPYYNSASEISEDGRIYFQIGIEDSDNYEFPEDLLENMQETSYCAASPTGMKCPNGFYLYSSGSPVDRSYKIALKTSLFVPVVKKTVQRVSKASSNHQRPVISKRD